MLWLIPRWDCFTARSSANPRLSGPVAPIWCDCSTSGMPDRQAKTVAARRGATVTIHLWEDRTRGELWVPSYDSSSLVLERDDFLRTTSGNAVDAGRRTFDFRAVRPGTHRLVFEKRLGWKFTAEDRRVFLISVSDGESPHKEP